MPIGRRRRLAIVAVVATVAAVLSACGAAIPESGPVVQGPAIGPAGDGQFIRVIVRPPAPGASPVEVVEGFLEASASFEDDYAIAREYLTRDASAAWSPALQTRVYDGSGAKVVASGASRVRFTAPLVGSIDSQDVYTVGEPGDTADVEFPMVREDGQWRISTPPFGLLLGRGDVDRGYRTYSVYFLNPDLSGLVPDPITVPSTGSGAATTLVRRLLLGPTDWLAPAVRTAFPNGVQLAIDSVPVTNGVAEVSLDAAALGTDDSTRAAMSAQLVWTLRQVPEVTGVRITAGGVPLTVPGQPSVQSRDAWPAFDPDALPVGSTGFALAAGTVVSITPPTVNAVMGRSGDDPVLSTLAISLDGTRVAGLDPKRTRLLVAPLVKGAAFQAKARGEELSSVGFGPDGSLWWVDSTGVQTLREVSAEPVPVPVEGVGNAKVVAVSVSRDGARAAVLLRRGPRTEVQLARVERRGETTRLAALRRVDSRVSSAVDVAWGSSTELQVLGSDEASPAQVFTIQLGPQPVRFVTAPEGALSLAAAPAHDVLVGTGDGQVWAYDALQWGVVVEGTSPAYPG